MSKMGDYIIGMEERYASMAFVNPYDRNVSSDKYDDIDAVNTAYTEYERYEETSKG